MQAGHGTCAEDSFSLQRFAACGVRGDVLLFNTVCVTTWQCSSAGSSVTLWKDKPAGISQWMDLLTDLKSNVSSQNRLATHLSTTRSNSEIQCLSLLKMLHFHSLSGHVKVMVPLLTY